MLLWIFQVNRTNSSITGCCQIRMHYERETLPWRLQRLPYNSTQVPKFFPEVYNFFVVKHYNCKCNCLLNNIITVFNYLKK